MSVPWCSLTQYARCQGKEHAMQSWDRRANRTGGCCGQLPFHRQLIQPLLWSPGPLCTRPLAQHKVARAAS